MRTSRFALLLLAVVVVGVALRVGYVRIVVDHPFLGNDSTWYFLEAGPLRHNAGFVDPSSYLRGTSTATAAFPPGYPVLLALQHALGANAIETFQLLGAVVGGVAVALTGVLGRSIAGPRVGIVAAAIAAVSPALIAADGSLMSENLYVPLVITLLLATLHAMRRPTLFAWALVGAITGVAILVRQDALLYLFVLVVPAALVTSLTPRAKFGRVATAIALTALIVSPWVVRNAVRVDDPNITTVSSSTLVGGANCRGSYYGHGLGLWDFNCVEALRAPNQTEAEWSRRLRSHGVRYAGEHLQRVPLVAVTRVASGYGLWRPRLQADFERLETRSEPWQLLSYAASVALLVVGVVGIVRYVKGRVECTLLLAPVIGGVILIALAYANSRFRVAAEPRLAVGAAVAMVSWFNTFRGRAPRRGNRPA